MALTIVFMPETCVSESYILARRTTFCPHPSPYACASDAVPPCCCFNQGRYERVARVSLSIMRAVMAGRAVVCVLFMTCLLVAIVFVACVIDANGVDVD